MPSKVGTQQGSNGTRTGPPREKEGSQDTNNQTAVALHEKCPQPIHIFDLWGQSLEPNDPTLYECIVRIEEVLNATLMMKN